VNVSRILAGQLAYSNLAALTNPLPPCLIRLCGHSHVPHQSVSGSITYWIRYVISYEWSHLHSNPSSCRCDSTAESVQNRYNAVPHLGSLESTDVVTPGIHP